MMRVLIVDDDRMCRLLITQHLLERGYEVAEAPNGREAWKLFQAQTFHMVITDWMMPDLDRSRTVHGIHPGGRYSVVGEA